MIVKRTYGTHKNLYIHTFLLTIFGPIYYLRCPPGIVDDLKGASSHRGVDGALSVGVCLELRPRCGPAAKQGGQW